MSVKLLRSVSVIALSASLAMPAPIVAQTQEAAPATEACPDGSEPVMQEGADAPVCPPAAEAADAAAEEGAAQTDAAESDATAAEAPAAEEAPPAADDTAAEPEAAEATPEVTEQTEPAAETQASEESAAPAEAQQAEQDAVPADAQQADQPATASEEQPTDAQAADAEEQPTEEETTAEQAQPAEAEEQPAEAQAADAEEQPAEAQAAEAEDQPTEEQPTDQAAKEAEGQPEEAGTTAADAPATATEEPADDAASDTAATEEPAATEEAEPTDAETTETAEGDAAAEAPAAEVAQEDTAETTAEANEPVATEAAAAAEEGTLDASQADNVEMVTEETARSSGEEFATTAAPAEQDDGGLSNLEIFALSALGGAAAAALLGQNEQVVVSSQDRLVVQDDRGNYRVLKNDDELLRRPGVEVATRDYSDGSTRTVVTREDGVRVVTIRAPDGQVLKRTRILPDGREIVLFDDTVDVEPVDMAFLERFRPQERVRAAEDADADALRAALQSYENPTDRGFSLQQIRQIRAVRELVPEIDLDEVNFETGSAVIRPEEAQDLSAIGKAIAEAIDENPNEVFLIEGHTDATGGAAMNLALSDRRAESAALALTEYFDIPPENLVVQGYGESNLKIRTNEAERANRRVAVRRITPLLYAQAN